jgi:hypothetical protein
MLGLFGGRGQPDHPLADAREAKRLLGGISSMDPHKALGEISDWIESVSVAEGFKADDRANLILLLDEAGQPHARKLAREYLNNSRIPKQRESKLWSSHFEFLTHLSDAYVKCIDFSIDGVKGSDALKSLLPVLGVRALRALGAQLKLLQMRYRPVHGDLWFAVGRIYRHLRSKKLHQKMVFVYPSGAQESCVEHEFIKVMMFAASSPDSMVPVEIELEERIIAHFVQHFSLTETPQPDTTYWIDLDEADPPLRLAQPPELTGTLVFFSAGSAIRGVEDLSRLIANKNIVPSDLNLDGIYRPDQVTEVLDHLAMYWAKNPPVRRHERHRVKNRLSVVHGYTGLAACLARHGSPADLDFSDENTLESWVVQNVSAGGFGATAPQVAGDWLRIGSVLGLRPDGGANWLVGMVRRLSRDADDRGNVGIQTIAKSAFPVDLRTGGSGAAIGAGILLVDPTDKAGEVRMLLQVDRFDDRRSIEMVRDGASHLLIPVGIIEQGDDYELVRYRDMRGG